MLGSLLATSGTSRPCRLVRAVMLRSCIALVGAVAAFGSIPSMAADIPAIGSTATGFIDIARMQVPLPAGTWVLAGRSYSSPADLDAVAYGAIESDVLLQADNKTATSFVIIDRNIIPVEDGWSTSQDCGKGGLVAPANYLTSETHVFCSFIQRVKTFQRDMNGANGAWKGAIDYARTNGIQVPSTWFMVGYRRTDRRELLDVRYHFASSSLKARATTAQSSQPSAKVKVVAFSSEPPRISAPVPGDPAHAGSVVALLERWRDLMRGPVESGFNNALTAEFSLALPGADDAAALPPGIAMKLKSLDDLRDRNVVTDIDYRLQRAAIIATSVN